MVDEHFPGFVECVLTDAEGRPHSFIEKVPVVTAEALRSTSEYPEEGGIRCTVERRWREPDGRAVVRVCTESPDRVASTEGQTRFTVHDAQLIVG